MLHFGLYRRVMLDDTKLDSKLEELSRELMSRPVVPGYSIAETFATCGLDESGKPGLFGREA